MILYPQENVERSDPKQMTSGTIFSESNVRSQSASSKTNLTKDINARLKSHMKEASRYNSITLAEYSSSSQLVYMREANESTKTSERRRSGFKMTHDTYLSRNCNPKPCITSRKIAVNTTAIKRSTTLS